ncbi:MAG TPA: DUF3189 family protein [Firmicutes bacterium]|nr:DUF3189 family protein [Candidatus Fermentithermobacillaceae bacterium]
MAELQRLWSGTFRLTEGSRGAAAKAVCDRGHEGTGEAVYLAWGFCPSPLALKVLESFLDLYDDPATAQQGASYPGETPAPPPRVFYVCYAGTHSSILASCLHLGKVRNVNAVCDLPFFDRRTHRDIGIPVKMGYDRNGAEVYALGTGWLSRAVELAACDLIELASPGARACLCSVRGYLDFFARVGGFASRRFGIVRLGRGLISSSLARKLPEMSKATQFCLDLTSRWKDNVGQPKGEVIWVNGPTAGRSYRGGGARRARGIPGASAGRPRTLRKRENP